MQVQGKTIAITRPAEDAMEFISLMESHGGQVIPLRTIEVAASTETIGREFLSSLEKFDPDYCAFLSSKSVRVLFESAKKESMYDEMVSAVKNTSVVAVGPRQGFTTRSGLFLETCTALRRLLVPMIPPLISESFAPSDDTITFTSSRFGTHQDLAEDQRGHPSYYVRQSQSRRQPLQHLSLFQIFLFDQW